MKTNQYFMQVFRNRGDNEDILASVGECVSALRNYPDDILLKDALIKLRSFHEIFDEYLSSLDAIEHVSFEGLGDWIEHDRRDWGDLYDNIGALSSMLPQYVFVVTVFDGDDCYDIWRLIARDGKIWTAEACMNFCFDKTPDYDVESAWF